MAAIRIVSVGRAQPERLRKLSAALRRLLGTECQLDTKPRSSDHAYDASRQQYRSDLLLSKLAAETVPGERILGVTDDDLFIPVLTFVFGEALLGRSAAIVSSHRLRNELYGLNADEDLLMMRLVKEAMHELGHTFGLLHCHNPTCVMQASTYAELIDLKSEYYCESCAVAVVV